MISKNSSCQERKQNYENDFHQYSCRTYHNKSKNTAGMPPLSHTLSYSTTNLKNAESYNSQMPANYLIADRTCYQHPVIPIVGNHCKTPHSLHQCNYSCLQHTDGQAATLNRMCHCRKSCLQKSVRATSTRLLPAQPPGTGLSTDKMCCLGYQRGQPCTEEEDSALPALQDREFHILHRTIPALRRTGVDTDGIRHYFYPEGGWGWIICGLSFLVHILSTGLQFSYGLLLFYAVRHLNTLSRIEWLGALSWSISMIATPFVIMYCRTKSPRLLAVIGGLVAPLGLLFTSFATELGQIVFSYGFVFSIGVAMIRESSSIMLGSYFKRRRKFVEMVAMCGEGVGVALFAVVLKEGIGEVGWRFGLQIIAALLSVTFFMGLLYRPASLYHPQRRAIQHLKNQHKKMRDNKVSSGIGLRPRTLNYFCLDISILNLATARILLLTSGVAALGIYTPIFLMSLPFAKGSDTQDLVVLQAFLGISMVVGVLLSGILMRHSFRIRQFLITYEVVCQVFISTVAIAILFLSFVMSYRGICILSWVYGIGFGGFRYSLKILALEHIKLRQFSKAWGMMKGIEAIPVIISVPLTFFLNEYSMKYGSAGYYICSAAAAIGAIIIFFINYSSLRTSARGKKTSTKNDTRASLCNNTIQRSKFHSLDLFGDELLYEGCRCLSVDSLHQSCINLDRGPYYEHCNLTATPYLSHSVRRHSHLPEVAYSPTLRSRPIHEYSNRSSVKERLKKSISFIQQPHCGNSQWFCNCITCIQHDRHGHQEQHAINQPLFCTCASLPAAAHIYHGAKSHSVPEGLSVISNQCNCNTTAMLSRNMIYMQREAEEFNTYDSKPILPQASRPKRSQSVAKPIHFVEQITTSV